VSAKLTLFVAVFFSAVVWAKPFRIAALYPESMAGHFHCTCGLEAQCMTKAAVADAKKKGIDVSLDLFGSGRTPFTALSAAKKVTAGNYDAVVGTLVSSEALIVSKVFEGARLPFIVPTASHPDVTRGKNYVTRIAFNDYRQAMLLAKFTREDFSGKNIAIIRNQSNPYSEFLGLQYAVELKKRGTHNLKDFPIIDGFSGFKSIAKELVDSHVGLVFVPLPQTMLASLYFELVRMNADITLLGSDIVEGEVQFLRTLGETSPKVRFIFVKHWNGKLAGPKANDFAHLRNTYCKQYAPTMTGAAAFDAISIVLDTLKSNPGTTKENLIARLKSAKYDGMTGPIVYDQTGDPIKPLQLFTIEHNRAQFWRTYQ